jgi:hypothetical protein
MARKAKVEQKSEGDAYLDSVKRMFSNAQDLCEPARQEWQTDQDYYDGFQYTPEEISILNSRKQPALVFNHVKPAVNSIIGIVERGKTDPKAWGRTPKDTDAAEVVTDGLRYVADVNRFQSIRSAALKDLLIQGVCVATVEIQPDKEVKITKGRPEAFFYDPFSRSPEFDDARFVGLANWMDEADVAELYPDKEKDISESVNANGVFATDTYMDRPKSSWAWADNKTRRVMVVEIYHKEKGTWRKCVFVSGVILESGVSEYKDAKGRPRCPLIAQSAYVDRDNRRYGTVRDMRGPQDAINKGRSKAVHLLNVAKLRVDPGVSDVDSIRAEYAKPDGIIEAREGQVEQLGGQELLPAHIELLRDAKAEMQRQSPTPGIVGRQNASQSGRAILAEQQAGMTEQSPLLGRFEDWTLRVYRACWATMKQFWTDQQYIRVTDDEDSPKFIMFNEPALLMDPNNPGHPVIGQDGQPVIDPNKPPRNAPAQMDVDIIIDSSPDVANLAEEQFQKLAELIQAGVMIPPEALIEASSLPKKRQILDKMDKAKQAAEGQQQPPNPAEIEAAKQQARIEGDKQAQQVSLAGKQAQIQMDSQAHAQSLMRENQLDAVKHERVMAQERHKQITNAQQHHIKMRQTAMGAAVDTHKVMLQQSAQSEGAEETQDDGGESAESKQMTLNFDALTVAERQSANAMMASAQAMHEMAQAVSELVKIQLKPKKLVKNPVTGEKTVEIVHDPRMN